MSVGSILLVLEWLLGGELKDRLRKGLSDPAVLSLIALYGVHLLGLFYTSDWGEASKDLRIALPLLLFPLAMGGRRDKTPYRPLFAAFFLAFFLSSFLSYLVWMNWLELPWGVSKDPTIFISAIRLSLMGCIAFFFALFLLAESKKIGRQLLLGGFCAWTLFYLGTLATGISMIVFLALLLYSVERWRRRTRNMLPAFLLLTLSIIPPLYLAWEVKTFYEVEESPINDKGALPEKTSKGHSYQHFPEDGMLENGYYVRLYISEPELKKAWNERSDRPFEGADGHGDPIKATLIRYMSSKGLKKDAEGMKKMNKADIERVEKGIANLTLHRMNPVRKRIRKAIFEIDRYFRGEDPSGNSITQRFEYWRAAWYIIQKEPLTGVGTGDPKRAFDRAYDAIDTELKEAFQLRAHQQFLTSWVTWGPLGFIILLSALFLPAIRKGAFRNPYYCIFFITLFLSFFTEDTLETQAGVTLFAFWNAFLLFRVQGSNEKEAERKPSP